MNRHGLQEVESEARKHHLIGNALCLDFANTLYGHSGRPIHEYLYEFVDIVIWSHRAGVLEEPDAEKLIRIAGSHPSAAQSIFRRALTLRETIFRVFSALPAATLHDHEMLLP